MHLRYEYQEIEKLQITYTYILHPDTGQNVFILWMFVQGGDSTHDLKAYEEGPLGTKVSSSRSKYQR